MEWNPDSKEARQKRTAWQIAMELAIQNKSDFVSVYNGLIKSFGVDKEKESNET